MKVLFLSELFFPHGSGAELATYLYAKLLSEAEIDVVVVTNRFAGESEVSRSKHLTVYRLPLLKGDTSVKYSILRRFDVLLSSFMRDMIKWADVVYIPRFWYSGILVAKSYGKPVVVHLHDYIPICPLALRYNTSEGTICSRDHGICSSECIYTWERIRGRRFLGVFSSLLLNSYVGVLMRGLVKQSDSIVCVSETQRNIIMKADKSLQAKLCTIYNPLPDVGYITLEGDDFGYFGGPNYLKGFHLLYHALGSVSRDGYRIRVHATKFSHFSDFDSDSLRERGFTLYEKLGRTEYEKVYGQIRCVIVPSVWEETFSYTVLEALLSGRMVIASKIGAIPEVSSGCEGVLLFSSENYEQLAENIISVRNLSRETVIDIGKRNRDSVMAKFSNEKTSSQFVHLLDNISHK